MTLDPPDNQEVYLVGRIQVILDSTMSNNPRYPLQKVALETPDFSKPSEQEDFGISYKDALYG